ncbi:MAG: ABC-F family ATP-binding cassette domain-containing protein [Clostridia bacterium]|nr:ABC-F family ATP-binding cassette domain-containing protein [Clostridia bacterium]
MSVLHVENLTKSYADRTLFSDVSFEIAPGERVGLIGVNGCGKTTLMHILMGKEPYDSGSFGVSRGAKITYVEQIPELHAETDLYSFTLEAFRPLLDLEEEETRILEKLNGPDADTERLIARQAVVVETLAREGGATFRALTRSALLGLGFTEDELSRSVTTFSGGQISKAMLARAILSKTDLLFLDEPTNNLDVTAIRWLSDYLRQFKGAVLVVSHDRAFLDDTVTRMLELQHGHIRGTQGNYSRYMELKLDEREFLMKKYLRQKKEIRRIEGIIEQQKRWNQERNYVTIASKQHQIDRIKEEMIEPEKDEKSIRFRFPTPAPTGNEVIVLHELGMRYGDQRVFSRLNAMIKAGQCVCLIGPNGCGKTTLLKILTGSEQQTEGTYKIGAGVRLGYYAQNTYDLNDEKTVLGELYDAFPSMDIPSLRGALGRFLFKNDDLEKRIGTLSGGEKARIRLLKLVLSGANVQLLDEPTKQLDNASAEMLESALEQFEGTSLIVSHDRYLVRRLADRVILMTEDGLIEQRDENEDLFERIVERKPEKPKQAERQETDNAYLRRKEQKMLRVKARQEVARIERLISKNEQEKIDAENMLAEAQERNDYRLMQQLYETVSALETEETKLYETLEAAERAAEAIQSEDEI